MNTNVHDQFSLLALELLRGLLLILFVGLLSSCDYNNSKALNSPSAISEGEFGKAAITFAEVSAKILEPRCVSCHAGYKNYSAVSSEISSIVSAVESGRMPKRGPPIDENLLTLLKNWAQAGAPESSLGPRPGNPIPEALKPNWESLSVKVFFPKCVVCHNSNGEAKFLDLSSRQKFFEQRNREFLGERLLDFEKPDTSYILQVIADIEEPMPPTSSGFTRLSEEEMKILTEWIRLGLP